MKILKTLKSLNGVTLAAALAAVLVSANANAEFVLGGDVGYASNTVKRDFSAEELGNNGSSFGVFGQYIFAAQPGDAGFGVHIGYATESGEVSRAGNRESRHLRTSYFAFENTFDILGVYRTAEFGKGWSGLVMLGYSRRKMEFGYENLTDEFAPQNGQKDSATHTGYKIAAGVQKIFRASWSMQAQVQYADYGKEHYGHFGPREPRDFDFEADMTSLGLRIGIAHHF